MTNFYTDTIVRSAAFRSDVVCKDMAMLEPGTRAAVRIRPHGYLKEWRERNPDKLDAQRARAAERRRVRMANDPEFKKDRNAKQAIRNAKHFQKTKVSHSATWYLKAARKRAAERNLPYDLDAHKSYYQAILDAGVCQMTGLPFQREQNRQGAFAPTFDRIIPELGYVHGNVRIVVWALNRAMGVWGFDFLADLVDRASAVGGMETKK